MQEITQAQAAIADLRLAMESAIDDGSIVKIEPTWDHHFANGLYGRRIYVPGGTTVVTKVHMTQHITIALKGRCTVVNEVGEHKEISAPGMWVTEPGTQRAIFCHDDTEWVTVHATDIKDDVPAVENEIFSDSFDEYYQRVSALPSAIDVKLRLTI